MYKIRKPVTDMDVQQVYVATADDIESIRTWKEAQFQNLISRVRSNRIPEETNEN